MSTSNQPTRDRQGWRGRQSVRQESETVRHQWQRGAQNEPASADQKRRNRFRLQLGFFAALALAGLAFLLSHLLFSPPLTPVIVISGGEYQFPVPPNAWAAEDVAGLMQLDRHSLRVSRLSDATPNGAMPNEILRALRNELAPLVESNSETVVLYFNMHGVVRVDENGATPCLMPAAASHLDPSEWLPLPAVLDVLKSELPARANKLIVLDAHRVDVDFDLGVLRSDFAARVAQMLKRDDTTNLAVLCAAGEGERSWWSPQLAGSTFGHYLQRGLRGEADSDRNRQVTTRELGDYLGRHVDGWARRNRGARQRPQLLSGGNGRNEFNVAWVASPGDNGTAATAREASVTASELDALWAARDRSQRYLLRGAAVGGLRIHPAAWRRLEQKLAWLETAAQSGHEYSAVAVRVRDELQQAFPADPEDPQGLRDYLNAFQIARDGDLPATLKLHSLATTAYLGGAPVATLRKARAAYREFADQPTPDSLAAAVDQLEQMEREDELPRLVETEFLRSLRDNQAQLPWDDPDRLQRIALNRIHAEDAAVPADERALYWFRPAVATVDHLRRLSEDRLTASTAGQPADFARLAEQRLAQIPYEGDLTVQKPLSSVLHALAARDRAFGDIAELAQWSTAWRLNDRTPASPEDAQFDDQLGFSIDAAHRVDRLLSHHENVSDTLAELPPALSALDTNLSGMRTTFENHCKHLIDVESVNGAVVRQIDGVLDSPLADADCRRELRAVRARFTETNRFDPETAPDVGDKTRLPSPTGRHPALALMKIDPAVEPPLANARPAAKDLLTETAYQSSDGGDEDSESQSDLGEGGEGQSLVQQGELLRRRLRLLPISVRDYQESLVTGSRDDLRGAWSDAASLVRSASGFWFPQPDVDPIGRLRAVDLQQLMIWQAERALGDFSGLPTGETRFYERVAADYLTSAQSILALDDTTQRRYAQQQSQLRKAAVDGVTVSVDAQPRTTPDEDVRLTVRLQSKPSFEFPVPPGAEPATPGFLRLQIRDMQGDVLLRGEPQALPLDDQTIQLQLPSGKLATTNPVLEAVATFRGHEYSEAFEVDLFRGQRIDLTAQPETPTKVTVFEGRTKEKSVIFVLDCSASMAAEIDIDGTPRTRMEVAGDALLGMLEQLSSQNNVRVGVLFFGQRAGWSTDRDQPVVVLRNPDYMAAGFEIPDDLMPSQDVETVVELGRFDLASLGAVSRRLRGVRPWGQTPLYLAVSQGLSQLAQDDLDADKSIVVITDGANNQFTATSSLVRPPKTGVGEVRQTLDRNRIPIHVIGFGVPAGERATAVAQFAELAALSGGSSSTVEGAPDLVRSLQGLVGEGAFVVENAFGANLGVTANGRSGKAGLGVPLTLKGEEATEPQPIVVRVNDVVSERVAAPPGRWLEFVLSPDKRSLLSRPFETDAVAQTYLTERSGGRRTGLLFRVHRPTLNDGDVRFGFSIQNTAALVTESFQDVWIDVTPTDASGKPVGSTYTFYDPRFQVGKPVPYLQWTATNWPVEATRAAVQVWLRREAAASTATIPLASVFDPDPAEGPWRSIDGLDDRTFQLRAVEDRQYVRISVIERLDEATASAPFTRVQLHTERLRPVRTVRRFDPEHHVATHAFWFALSDRETLRRSTTAQLRFTKRSDVQRGAIEIDPQRPLSAGVYSDSGLLPAP